MPDSQRDGCRLVGHMRLGRAVAFDFNGTLSDDEPILLSVYRELFAEQGRPLTDAEYYETLAGLSEEAIIGTWLGVEGDALEPLVEERIERYLARCGRGETVSAPVRDAVSYAARRVPVAVVSGAFRREIEPVLVGAGLDRHVSVLVTADDVERGKPDPAAYRLAVDLIDGDVAAEDVVAFEDTESGVASAKAAGLRCVALVGTHPPDRLARADELVEAIDVDVLRRILG
jgi:beta-phosphoglucomutase